ncbi:MAG TPA: AAA family ATPase [Candidatus Dormibacteraeota bacterium]|nr:AAA family ATPase [Candidatus Dormibacteraeota bacterium]
MLFGRESETQAVNEALAAARLGRSSRLVIRGEPGIGKSALLEHAVAQAEGMRVLAAHGVEFEADVPFAGLNELLRPALGLLDRLPGVHAAALRSSLGLGERIEADRLIVGAAVLGLISAYAEQGPLLMTVDDAHWLDPASAEAIAFAARRLVADPVAILVAVREGHDSPFLASGWPEIKLAGLDEDAASHLLEKLATVPPSHDSLDRLLRATGGNPLALVELARSDSPAAGSPHLDLPVATSVERAYLRRADGLAAGARQVLVIMSASGVSDLGLVRRAASRVGIETAAVEAAEAASSLVQVLGDRVEFVHPLARAAIYHAAAPAERRAAHAALASVMTGADDADRRAWHLAAAATGWDAEAAEALAQAAQRAQKSTAYRSASAALAESARLTEDSGLRAERSFRAAENAWLAGDADRSLDLLAAARRLTTSTELLVDIDSLDAHIAMRRGSVAEGYAMQTAAASAIEPLDRLKAIRIFADAALSTFWAGRPGERLAAATRALALLKEDDPPELAIFAQVAYGALAILAGRGPDGPRRLRESVPLFARVKADSADPLLLMCTGTAGLFLREAEAGRELLDRALRQARERAPTAALPMVLFMLGRDAAATDRWSIARAQYEESERVARETTQFTWLAGATAGMAWLDALEGRVEECRTHAAEARQVSEQYGMGFFAAWSMIALGQLELGLGNPQAAIAHFVECATVLEQMAVDDPDIAPAPDMVDALVHLGRTEEAQKMSDDYSRTARDKGLPFAQARAARARALLADDSSYAEEFEAALRHHEGTPDAFERARTHLYYGERLRRTRRRVDARKQLRAALKTFDQLGASPWSDRARSELEASGETARVRDDRFRQQLTPQELQVALTLAEGSSTREAAAKLYLSPKTVEYHLRHVYDKLEIRTRDELRGALISQGRPQTSRKALMFTDLADSTRLVEVIGDAAWNNLSAWLDGEMRRTFEEHHGREIDHAGDGFFVVFEMGREATDCAIAIQRRLDSHRRLHGYAPQVRIGLHVGEVSTSDSSVRGAAVHRAARLCAAAGPDEIIASREALEASGRPLTGLKKLALKGIKEPVEAAEVDWQG